MLNVKNRTQLRIVRKGPWGYAYAMANMRWFTTAEAQSQEIVTPASSQTIGISPIALANQLELVHPLHIQGIGGGGHGAIQGNRVNQFIISLPVSVWKP